MKLSLEYLGPGRVLYDGVEFRAVRDLSHLSEAELKIMAAKGIAAKDLNGKKLDGHHYQQLSHRSADGFIVEIPENLHDYNNKIQHPKGKGAGLEEQARKEWNNTLRKNYWKERARTELLRRENKPK
ncbi:HNH/ENDO VII family nuclease [Candidatus Odyssella thessalonicensis]|uniref:HNH/ENDO VII family nuclease n=1 Tax=Candidatus Odyssella thessalonicensis TaxID=84647 RepID=UPI000225BFC3|nr:HNH/ENDO VII family nuclease [Candidatus Odyssella thessalonicensis]